ncbi:DotI/IcmL/TraM family protein [Salmonella enterica]|nr:DotI/IcmL/TraM family protein [Salmonella enterica]
MTSQLQAFVMTTGGQPWDFGALRHISSNISGLGGYVWPDNQAVGAGGGWKMKLADYGAKHIREDFTLDFVHYREQINARRDGFSTAGFTSYYNALVTSNVLANIRDKKMNLSALTSTGVINSKGVLDNGAYAWRLQYPITLRLNGQTSSLPPQNFTLIQIVTRADPRLKKDGLEVIQVITREAAEQ